MYWTMSFYKFGCSYVMLYNIQNAWCLFCFFCDYWLETIKYNMYYIYTCATNVLHACESKMASILNLIVDSSVGCPLYCQLFPYLKVVGCPLSCPLSWTLYPYIWKKWAALFAWQNSHGQPTPLPTELPTVSIYRS